MTLGTLDLLPALEHPELLADPVFALLSTLPPALAASVSVAAIDPDLADTAAFCDRYDVGLGVSANCVIVAGRRGETTSYAACMVLATTRADVNGVVRQLLDARKASFAPMDDAVALSGMEYGGITSIGLPAAWPILIDSRIPALPEIVIGSGLRRSKIVLPGQALTALPGSRVVEGLARPAPSN